MFNLVKWAFKLGQQTERHRMAGVLERERRAVPWQMDLGKETVRQEVDRRLGQAVNNIIDHITVPNRAEGEHYSLLYPDGFKDN